MTEQNQQARELLKAQLGMTDEQLDARILAIAAKLREQKPVPRPLASLHFERKYFYIQDGHFETVVDQRDAATIDEAYIFACGNTKQAWYYVRDSYVTEKQITEWNHNQFVDWLRR